MSNLDSPLELVFRLFSENCILVLAILLSAGVSQLQTSLHYAAKQLVFETSHLDADMHGMCRRKPRSDFDSHPNGWSVEVVELPAMDLVARPGCSRSASFWIDDHD